MSNNFKIVISIFFGLVKSRTRNNPLSVFYFEYVSYFEFPIILLNSEESNQMLPNVKI